MNAYKSCGLIPRCNCAIVISFNTDSDMPHTVYIDFCNFVSQLPFAIERNVLTQKMCDEAPPLKSREQAFDDAFWNTNRSKYATEYVDCAKLRNIYFVSAHALKL